MDFTKIFDLLSKGLSVIQALNQAAQDAGPAIKAMIDLVTGAQAGKLTDEQLANTEALLDQLIEDFNQPMES